ncbi:MAG TPA: hypothetical protein VMU19_07640 [Bryobacteraceae bacterium]|nr:hypothetical protein [Bryobacteraceae bacterium]
MSVRFFLVFALAALASWAANVKLYLKDGGYQLCREYQVQADNVHFYSVERSEWEDIPVALVDLKRTEAEAAAHEADLQKEAALAKEEQRADKQLQEEIARIPQDPGVYWVEGNAAKTIERAETNLHTEVGKSILRHLSPSQSPVTKTAAMEIKGARSSNIFTNPNQEFYVQLGEPATFGIVRLTSKGSVRIAETVGYYGSSDEVSEERELVDTMELQLAEGLYRIWPKTGLRAGEYAVVQYHDGKADMQVWDFAVKSK